jgi:hypothetical protein
MLVVAAPVSAVPWADAAAAGCAASSMAAGVAAATLMSLTFFIVPAVTTMTRAARRGDAEWRSTCGSP